MKDTPRHISEMQAKIIHSKTNEVRSIMGAEMVDSVYKMVKERLKEESPGLTEKEITAKVFLRFYQNEFSEQEKELIVDSIKNG